MKKTIIAASVVIGAAFAGSAMAAGAAFTGNTTVTKANCPMLVGDTDLAVSSNVHGMWACFENTNTINVGACHEGGSSDPVKCARYDSNGDGVVTSADSFNYSSCTLEGEIPADETPNYKAFVVGSGGGTVAGLPLSGRCDNTSIAGLDFFQ